MAPQIVLEMVRSVPVEPTDHHDGSPCSLLSLPRVAFGGESVCVHQQQHPQLHQACKPGRTACWQQQQQQQHQQQQQQQQAAAEAKVEAESEAKGG